MENGTLTNLAIRLVFQKYQFLRRIIFQAVFHDVQCNFI